MSNRNLKIDFFVVGSQRCGTTWIDTALRSTGKVLLPKNKQTYFFDRNYDLGISWYEQQFEISEIDNDKYELVGEVATGYCLEGAIDLLAKNYPEVKIILTVREPVSRAYSNYIKRKDDYHGMSFEKALYSNNDLVERGLYGDMLKRILKHYPLDRVKIVFFDDLEKNPRGFLDEIVSFLDINCEVDEKLFTQNVNSSLLEGFSKTAKKMKIYFVIRLIKKMGLTSFVRAIIYKMHKMKGQPSFLKSPKLQQLFDSSNRTLRDISNRDLRDWRKEL